MLDFNDHIAVYDMFFPIVLKKIKCLFIFKLCENVQPQTAGHKNVF